MHGPHSLFSVLTKRVNRPYSQPSEVLTKDTGVIPGLPIDGWGGPRDKYYEKNATLFQVQRIFQENYVEYT